MFPTFTSSKLTKSVNISQRRFIIIFKSIVVYYSIFALWFYFRRSAIFKRRKKYRKWEFLFSILTNVDYYINMMIIMCVYLFLLIIVYGSSLLFAPNSDVVILRKRKRKRWIKNILSRQICFALVYIHTRQHNKMRDFGIQLKDMRELIRMCVEHNKWFCIRTTLFHFVSHGLCSLIATIFG